MVATAPDQSPAVGSQRTAETTRETSEPPSPVRANEGYAFWRRPRVAPLRDAVRRIHLLRCTSTKRALDGEYRSSRIFSPALPVALGLSFDILVRLPEFGPFRGACTRIFSTAVAVIEANAGRRFAARWPSRTGCAVWGWPVLAQPTPSAIDRLLAHLARSSRSSIGGCPLECTVPRPQNVDLRVRLSV